MLDDVVSEDTVDAAGRHWPWPGQVEILLGPPHDVGVDPLVQAYVACPHVHPDRRGHRRDRPLESPGQQRRTYRGERVVDHRPRGFRDLSTHTRVPPDCPRMDETSHKWTPERARRITGRGGGSVPPGNPVGDEAQEGHDEAQRAGGVLTQ